MVCDYVIASANSHRSSLKRELSIVLKKYEQEQSAKKTIETHLVSAEKQHVELELELEEMKQVKSIQEDLKKEIVFVSRKKREIFRKFRSFQSSTHFKLQKCWFLFECHCFCFYLNCCMCDCVLSVSLEFE